MAVKGIEPISYAFDTDGCASSVPIALWTASGKQVRDKPGVKAEEFAYQIDFEPIQGAYVACVRVADGQVSIPVDRDWDVRYGRTNNRGWVVKRDLDALLAEAEADIPELPWEPAVPTSIETSVPLFGPLINALFPVTFAAGSNPCADPTLMAGLPNEDFRIFWCYERALFEQFVDAFLNEDPNLTLDTWGAQRFSVVPFGDPTPFPDFDLVSEVQRTRLTRLLFPGDRRGYHWGRQFKDHRTAAIFDATPPALRSLYASEWLLCACERLLQDDWPYLLSLLPVVRAAQGGSPIPDLAQRMVPEVGRVGTAIGEVREYLHACAKKGWRDGKGVRNAVRISVGSDRDWEAAGRKTEEDYGLSHPAKGERNLDKYFFSDTTQAALVGYFHMYAAGFDHAHELEVIEAHWSSVQKALGYIHARQHDVLSEGSHVDLLRELGLHLPADASELRKDLLDRYHVQCAAVGLEFWRVADIQLKVQTDWDRQKPFIKWIGPGSALLAELTAPLFTQHLTAYQNLSGESVEAFIRYFYRYHLSLAGRSVEQTLRQAVATVRLEPGSASDRLVARVYDEQNKAKLLGEFDVVTSVKDMPGDERHAPLGKADSGTAAKRYGRAMDKGQIREFRVEDRFVTVRMSDGTADFVNGLTAVGELVSTAAAIASLVQEVKQKHGKLRQVEVAYYLDAVQSTFALVDAGSVALAPIFKAASVGADSYARNPLVRGAAFLGNVARAASSIRDVVAGGTTIVAMLDPHTSTADVAMYMDSGQTVATWLEGTKGVVQVATGASGGAALLLGTSTAVAALPLGVWVAVGAVAIATLDVAIYATTGGATPVDGFLKDVKGAMKEQFRRDGDRILAVNETYEYQPPGRSATKPMRAHCKTARKLGSINQLAQSHLSTLRG